MKNKVILLLLLLIVPLVITSCDIGNVITDIELGKYPDNIVYYVGESDSIDLSGGTLYSISRDNVSERSISTDDTLYEIVDNIDFSLPGVYEVHIVFQPPRGKETKTIRIPVQVIERGLD